MPTQDLNTYLPSFQANALALSHHGIGKYASAYGGVSMVLYPVGFRDWNCLLPMRILHSILLDTPDPFVIIDRHSSVPLNC